MKIKFEYRPKKIPFRVKNEFDMLILLTRNTKWPKINKFLLRLGFLWTKEILLDHFEKPMCIVLNHKICNKVIITDVDK